MRLVRISLYLSIIVLLCILVVMSFSLNWVGLLLFVITAMGAYVGLWVAKRRTFYPFRIFLGIILVSFSLIIAFVDRELMYPQWIGGWINYVLGVLLALIGVCYAANMILKGSFKVSMSPADKLFLSLGGTVLLGSMGLGFYLPNSQLPANISLGCLTYLTLYLTVVNNLSPEVR